MGFLRAYKRTEPGKMISLGCTSGPASQSRPFAARLVGVMMVIEPAVGSVGGGT